MPTVVGLSEYFHLTWTWHGHCYCDGGLSPSLLPHHCFDHDRTCFCIRTHVICLPVGTRRKVVVLYVGKHPPCPHQTRYSLRLASCHFSFYKTCCLCIFNFIDVQYRLLKLCCVGACLSIFHVVIFQGYTRKNRLK